MNFRSLLFSLLVTKIVVAEYEINAFTRAVCDDDRDQLQKLFHHQNFFIDDLWKLFAEKPQQTGYLTLEAYAKQTNRKKVFSLLSSYAIMMKAQLIKEGNTYFANQVKVLKHEIMEIQRNKMAFDDVYCGGNPDITLHSLPLVVSVMDHFWDVAAAVQANDVETLKKAFDHKNIAINDLFNQDNTGILQWKLPSDKMTLCEYAQAHNFKEIEDVLRSYLALALLHDYRRWKFYDTNLISMSAVSSRFHELITLIKNELPSRDRWHLDVYCGAHPELTLDNIVKLTDINSLLLYPQQENAYIKANRNREQSQELLSEFKALVDGGDVIAVEKKLQEENIHVVDLSNDDGIGIFDIIFDNHFNLISYANQSNKSHRIYELLRNYKILSEAYYLLNLTRNEAQDRFKQFVADKYYYHRMFLKYLLSNNYGEESHQINYDVYCGGEPSLTLKTILDELHLE